MSRPGTYRTAKQHISVDIAALILTESLELKACLPRIAWEFLKIDLPPKCRNRS
jgi:hypothetical protein